VDSPVDIYTISVQDAGQTVQTSIVVSRMTQQQLVNTLRLMVTNAKKQAETALIEARKHGKTLPEDIKQKYAQGLEELANAVNAIQSQNYVSAQESLKEAMNLFREIVAYTYCDDIEAPVDTDQLRNRVQELINQLTRQYKEINAVVQRLKQYGLNVDALEREMSLLRNRIGEAQSLLDQGKVNEAQQSAIRTQQLVQQRLAELRQKQAEITKRLVSKYQASLENRVAAYIDTFNKIQSVRPVQSALALQELEALQVRLVYSGELIDENNIASALREMYATEYRLRRLAVTVNGDVTIRLLNRIDELTANLQDSTGTAANQIENEIENTKDSLSDYLRDRRPISPSNSPSPTGP